MKSTIWLSLLSPHRPSKLTIDTAYNVRRNIAREYSGCIILMDFDMLTSPLTVCELSCVETKDNVCIDAHVESDLIYVHRLHMTYLKLVFSKVKIILNSLIACTYLFSFKWTVKLQTYILITIHFNYLVYFLNIRSIYPVF